MKAYRVIAAFKHGGQRIVPPCMWTPPSQAVADKLVKARCLKAEEPTVEINIGGGVFGREPVLALMDDINKAVSEAQLVGPHPEPPGIGGGPLETLHVQSEEIPQKHGEPEAVAAEASPAPPQSPATPPEPPAMTLPAVGAVAAASEPPKDPPKPKGGGKRRRKQ